MKIADTAQATENARQSIPDGDELIAISVQDFNVQKMLANARAQLEKCLALTEKR